MHSHGRMQTQTAVPDRQASNGASALSTGTNNVLSTPLPALTSHLEAHVRAGINLKCKVFREWGQTARHECHVSTPAVGSVVFHSSTRANTSMEIFSHFKSYLNKSEYKPLWHYVFKKMHLKEQFIQKMKNVIYSPTCCFKLAAIFAIKHKKVH